MVRSTWLRRAGPGIVALGAVALLASTTLGARDRPWDPPECADVRGRSGRLGAGRSGAPRRSAAERAPWFRLDPVLDGAGALSGQRLVVGRAGGSGRRTSRCPPSPSPPARSAPCVLVGADDGTTSRLLAVDVLDGCVSRPRASRSMSSAGRRSARTAPRSSSSAWIVGRARTSAPGGDGLAGSDAARDGPDPAADRAGRSVRADLVHRVPRGADDGSLAVESCGEVACRTRVVGPARATGPRVGDPDLGDRARPGGRPARLLPGLSRPALPDRRHGPGRRGGDGPWSRTPDRGRDVDAGRRPPRPRPRRRPRRDAPFGRPRRVTGASTSDAVPDGLRPARPTPSRAGAGLDVPPGWVRAGTRRPPGGRRPASGLDPPPRRSTDGPPPSRRCSHDASTAPRPRSPSWRSPLLTAGATGRLRRPQPGPGPGGEPVRPGPGPRVRLAIRLRAGRLDRHGHQGRRRRRHRHARRSRAATFVYDSGGSEPDRLRPGRDVRREWDRLLHADRADVFTMWLREQGHVFDWGTLKWCQAYTTAPERLLRRRDRRARRVRPHRDPRPPPEPRRRERLHRRRRPDVLADEAQRRLEHARPRCLRRRDAPARVRHDVVDGEVLDLRHARDHPHRVALRRRVAYGGKATVTATLKVTDLDRLRAARGESRSPARVVTLQTRAPGTTTWLAAGTMATGTTSGTYTKALTLTADIQVRAVFKTPTDEGLTGGTSPTVTIDVGTVPDPLPVLDRVATR